MDRETARRWLEIMAKNVFDPNQTAYIVVLQRVEALERKNARAEWARKLHREWHSIDVEPQCDECGRPWPCPTRRALDGEEE